MIEMNWFVPLAILGGGIFVLIGLTMARKVGRKAPINLILFGTGIIISTLTFGISHEDESLGKPIQFSKLQERQLYKVEMVLPEINMIMLKKADLDNNEDNKPRLVENAPKELHQQGIRFLIEKDQVYYPKY